MIVRAESCVAVSSIWLAKNTIASSMIANRRPKKTGATSANSTAAEPRWLRRNRRRIFPAGAAGEDIKATSRRGRNSSRGLPETDCRSVSSDADGTTRSVRQTLTMSDDRLTSDAGYFRAAPGVFCFGAFSLREPAATPDQVRGRLSLENARKRAQLDDLAPRAAAPEAWLESEPAWSIAVLK